MDVFLIRGITEELKKEIRDGFINKIYQLNRFDLLLRIRRQGEEKNLLISTHPDYSRCHLTEKKYATPSAPPRFAAYLRKHLTGARVVDIVQEPYERIVRICCAKLLDANLTRKLTLVVELFGKKSNVFLLEGEKILGALHLSRMGGTKEQENIPGKNYVLPQRKDKLLPRQVTIEMMGEIAAAPLGEQWRIMVQKIAGLPPLLAKEIELISGGDPHKMRENFRAIWEKYDAARFEPQAVTFLNGKKILCPWPLTSLQGGAGEPFSSLNQGADNFYYTLTTEQQIKEQKQVMSKRLHQLLERLHKRKENLFQDREKLTKDLQLKEWGDVLLANYSKLKKGMKEIEAWDYSQDPSRSLIIPLDESLDPTGNVEKYFRKYKKAKRGLEMIGERIAATEKELNYLESVLYQIEAAEDGEALAEIREELTEARILSPAMSQKKKEQKIEGSLPFWEFRSPEGLTIYCGKHNLGNEFLLRHLARGNDLWFHAQGLPGSHVLLKVWNKTPNFTSILQAAMIAAYYSKGKDAGKIPVDYTEVKNVRKPKDSRPGYVTYFHQKTIFITAHKDEVEKLRRN